MARLFPDQGHWSEEEYLTLGANQLIEFSHGSLEFPSMPMVIEVVSDDDRFRDLDIKRREYAQAGIPESWIVDPQTRTISVLTLDGTRYVEQGVFAAGQRATSQLLAGFEVDVTATFDAATK